MSEQSASSRNEGVNCLYAGEVDRALAHLQGAVAEDPQDAQAQGFLGVCYVRKGNFAAAIPPLEQAVRLQPEDAAAHYNLAAALYQGDHPAEARAEVERALSLNPAHVSSRDLLERMNGGDSVPVTVPVVPAPDAPTAPSDSYRFGTAGLYTDSSLYTASGMRLPSDLGADHSLDDFGTSVPGLDASLGRAGSGSMGQTPFMPINLAGPEPEEPNETPAWAAPAVLPWHDQTLAFGEVPAGVPPISSGQTLVTCPAPVYDLSPPPGQAGAFAHSATLVAGGPGMVAFRAPVTPNMSGGESFARRSGAYIIDYFAVPAAVRMVIGFLVSILLIASGHTNVHSMRLFFILLELFTDLALLVLYAAMLQARGQTWGRMALGIQVIGPDGNPPGFFRALGRETIGQFISSILLGFGYWRVLWNGQQQTWHDELFGTRVVRK